MKVSAIVQARVGSTRLPGKVLLPLRGKPILRWVIDRLQASRTLDEVRIATTVRPDDAKVVQLAELAGVPVTRGPESDVLRRYCVAADSAGADLIVRVTADCPFVSHELVDRAVEQLLNDQVDHVSNTRESQFPKGLDVEAFTREALERANQEATAASDREHVTPYIWGHPRLFTIRSLKAEPNEQGPEFRLTVDTPEDYAMVCAVAQFLPESDFSVAELVELLRDRIWLCQINSHVRQKTVFGGSLLEQRFQRFFHAAEWCVEQDLCEVAECLLVHVRGLMRASNIDVADQLSRRLSELETRASR